MQRLETSFCGGNCEGVSRFNKRRKHFLETPFDSPFQKFFLNLHLISSVAFALPSLLLGPAWTSARNPLRSPGVSGQFFKITLTWNPPTPICVLDYRNDIAGISQNILLQKRPLQRLRNDRRWPRSLLYHRTAATIVSMGCFFMFVYVTHTHVR